MNSYILIRKCFQRYNSNYARENRKNVTPNGAIVPKKEFQLEYNIILRDWSLTIKNMIKKDKKLLSIFYLRSSKKYLKG